MTILTPRVYTILGMIKENPGICRRDLADKYGVKLQSASIGTAVRILKDRGCITKDPKSVGTKTAFYITEKGQRVLEAVAALEAVQ